MTIITCPACNGIGYDPLDADWGATFPLDCPCCKGDKVVDAGKALAYINDLRQQIPRLQNHATDLETKIYNLEYRLKDVEGKLRHAAPQPVPPKPARPEPSYTTWG